MVRMRVMLLTSLVLAVVGDFALASSPTGAARPRAVTIQGRGVLLTYQGQGFGESGGGDGGARFMIAGNATHVLYPGTSTSIDLVFTNETDEAIKLPARAIKIALSSPRPTCPATPNFSVVQTLTTAITIPKGADHQSLTNLQVASRFWPVISMVTTHVTQNACAGATITLHYSAQSNGDGD
jgi:hypothetical protein